MNHRVTASSTPCVILFEAECRMCDASVNWILAHDRAQKFRFAARESATGARLLTQFGIARLDSVALIAAGRAYTRSSAALVIAHDLGLPWSLFSILIYIPGFLRDAVYDWVASHRYRWFGKATACRLPTPDLRQRFLD